MQRRSVMFLAFLSLALSLYTALNSYIFFRGMNVVPENYRSWYAIIFVVISFSYIVGRVLERISLSRVSSVLVWVGSFWLAAMVYLYLILLGIDVLRLLNHFVPMFFGFFVWESESTKHLLGGVVVTFVSVIIVIGYLNARRPRIKTLDLAIAKRSHSDKTLNVVVASDIHLGTIICKSRLERIVREINRLEPDLVLLPGDVVDEDLGPVIRQNLGETLRTIKAKYGVVAITGNHEYIGGVEAACRYLTDHGIRMLRDEVFKVDGSFYLIGREDRSARQFGGRKRKPLEELMSGVDRSYPIILMDHQPFGLDEAVRNGIDLQLSGHTHHGQMWPFNYITQKVYELSWGYLKKEDTHIYVSCGVGTWGPPVRIGNKPEIVSVRIQFS